MKKLEKAAFDYVLKEARKDKTRLKKWHSGDAYKAFKAGARWQKRNKL